MILLGTGEQSSIVFNEPDLFPNPATNNFSLMNSKMSVQEILIYDLNGNLVRYFKEPQFSYNIKSLKRGLYTVVLKFSENIQYKKLIKN